jgi:hypothetical protein
MSPDVFLGRALMDPTTGLPNVPYFRLIREWEERRARRYKLAVRTVTLSVKGGDERARRALGWRLCRALRDSDFLASNGPAQFRILLTSPDAEQAEALCRRLEEIVSDLNQHLGEDRKVVATTTIEEVTAPPDSVEEASSN